MSIYQSKLFRRGSKVYELDHLAWVFECEACEYAFAYATEEAAHSGEHAHYVSAPSIHLRLMNKRNWSDSPLSQL